MKDLDNWTKTIRLFAHANNYDLDELKAGLAADPVGGSSFHSQFEEVLREHPFSTFDYARQTDILFGEEDALYRYLQAMYEFLFKEGPYPEAEPD